MTKYSVMDKKTGEIISVEKIDTKIHCHRSGVEFEGVIHTDSVEEKVVAKKTK